MKTKSELQAIIKSWWDYNQTLAQMPEAKYFQEQISDWESGFRNYTKEEWVSTHTAFTLGRCKDVKGGLSIRLESGPNFCDGILNTTTGVWTEKETNGMELGSTLMRGATIE